MEKKLFCQKLGADHVIVLSEFGNSNFVTETGDPNYLLWKKFKTIANSKIEGGLDVIFEHVGYNTIWLSIYLLKKGGKVVTCAASSGYLGKIDLRYLWMEVKSLIGSHFANLSEAKTANQLMIDKKIYSTTQTVISFKDIPIYLDKMYLRSNDLSGGKIGVKF